MTQTQKLFYGCLMFSSEKQVGALMKYFKRGKFLFWKFEFFQDPYFREMSSEEVFQEAAHWFQGPSGRKFNFAQTLRDFHLSDSLCYRSWKTLNSVEKIELGVLSALTRAPEILVIQVDTFLKKDEIVRLDSFLQRSQKVTKTGVLICSRKKRFGSAKSYSFEEIKNFFEGSLGTGEVA